MYCLHNLGQFIQRRDFCFVLFNICHSLNAQDFPMECTLQAFFKKFVLNKVQLNIIMSGANTSFIEILLHQINII